MTEKCTLLHMRSCVGDVVKSLEDVHFNVVVGIVQQRPIDLHEYICKNEDHVFNHAIQYMIASAQMGLVLKIHDKYKFYVCRNM